MNAVPKLLFYNWEPAFASLRRGGGVSVYQDNCISLFLNRGWQVHSLSAGTAYDLKRSDPYITKVESQNSHLVFALVNSPVVAPTIYSFFTNQVTSGQSSDRAVAEAIIAFIWANGPYEVIHFNNLEGLPAAVLPILRKEFQDSRFIFFVHNYYPMCPQVNLWKNDLINCDGKEGGKPVVRVWARTPWQIIKLGPARSSATVQYPMRYPEAERSRGSLWRGGSSENVCVLAGALSFSTFCAVILEIRCPLKVIRSLVQDHLLAYFRDREENMVRIINESFDVVLCDSERVRVISLNAGMSAEKCKTCYPGTAFYRSPLPVHKPSNNTPLKLAFIGVANVKFKGLDFLISALEQCPEAVLSKIHFVIAAKWIYRNPRNRRRLSALGSKLSGLTVREGYSHKELGELLDDVDLGVVPHLWEDCYPQVAVEFVCNGVPVIISNSGARKRSHPILTSSST